MMRKFGNIGLFSILLALLFLILPFKRSMAQMVKLDSLSGISKNLLKEVQIERMLNRVKDLSSPAFAGRELGTLGNKKAANWLSYTLPQIGLKPLPSLGTFKQEFRIANYKLTDSASNTLKIRNNNFLLHKDFVPAYFSASDSIAGVAKFIDPKWEDSLLKKAGNVSTNSIALVYNDFYSQQLDSYNQTHRLFKISERLAESGFEAVLFIAPPSEKLSYSNTATNYRFEDFIDLPKDAAKYMSNTPRPYVLPRATSVPVMLISNNTGKQILSNLGVDMNVENFFARLSDLSKSTGNNGVKFSDAKIHISVSIAKDDEKSAHNVIGILPGSEESNLFSDPFVMISSNFDQEGQHPEAGTPFYGANNNATSVASQLETAEILANAPNKPPYTIVFAFFNGRHRENSGLRSFLSDSLVNMKNLTVGYNLLELAGGEKKDPPRVYLSKNNRPELSNRIINKSTSFLNIKLQNSESYIKKLTGIYYNDSTVKLLQSHYNIPFMGLSGGYYTYSNRTLDSSDKLNLSQYYKITQLILDTTWKSAHYHSN